MTKTILSSPNAPMPIGPYSHGVLIGNTLYVSGQVGKDPITGEVILDDIKKETKRVMENLKGILAEGGMDFSNVVKAALFLTDLDNFVAVNEVYGSYFAGQESIRRVKRCRCHVCH